MADQNGGSGNDSFVGDAGADHLMGEGGDDTIDGAGGDDKVYGGDGNDHLEGGDGNDQIYGGAGDDTLSGGAGNDVLVAEGRGDTVYGGEGDDTAYGGMGGDRLEGGDGNDSVFGGDGGNDVVYGGAGNDMVYGGEGDDRVDGGTGDDELYGGNGGDVFVTSEGGGDDVIFDFNPSEGDIVEVSYPGVSNFEDLRPFLSDDGNWGTMISFPDGSSTHLTYYNYQNISPDDFTFKNGPICFLRGTLIDTPEGVVSIEHLRVGEMVITLDAGPQPIRFISHRRFRFGPGPHKMKPLRIKAGALAPGCPARCLILSPQHRVGLPLDRPKFLMPVRKMQGLPGITERPCCRVAEYYHLLLDRHALIRANGIWAETMLLTAYTKKGANIPECLRGSDMEIVRPDWRKSPIDSWVKFLSAELNSV